MRERELNILPRSNQPSWTSTTPPPLVGNTARSGSAGVWLLLPPCARLVRYPVVEQKLTCGSLGLSARHMRCYASIVATAESSGGGGCSPATPARSRRGEGCLSASHVRRPFRRGSATCARQTAASVRPCGGIDLRHSFRTDCPVRLGSFAGLSAIAFDLILKRHKVSSGTRR